MSPYRSERSHLKEYRPYSFHWKDAVSYERFEGPQLRWLDLDHTQLPFAGTLFAQLLHYHAGPAASRPPAAAWSEHLPSSKGAVKAVEQSLH